MNNKELTEEQRKIIDQQIQNEATESLVYNKLALLQPEGHNREILQGISNDEQSHAQRLISLFGGTATPKRFKAFIYVLIARFLGLSFGLKLMENGESDAGKLYHSIESIHPDLQKIAADEEAHEMALLGLLNDERLQYMGAIVLGLNDALIELTGALAGFTFALSSPKLIAVTGLITGIAAALSMSASSFLSAEAGKDEDTENNSGKTALYTGVAYAVTVVLLISPYMILSNVKYALVIMLAIAILIIAVFNFYLSVAKTIPFKKNFLTMAGLSTLVAAISFGVGYLLKMTINI